MTWGGYKSTSYRIPMCGNGGIMINFEEELKKYEPSPDVEQVETLVNANNLSDVTDIVKELITDARTTVSL